MNGYVYGGPQKETLGILQQLENLVPPTKLTRFKWLAVELRKVQCNGPRAEHQEYLDTKAGGLLLSIESFIAAVVAEASIKAKENYRTGLSPPREVIPPVPAPPRRSAWEQFLVDLRRMRLPWWLWVVCLYFWFSFWSAVSGSPTWGLIATGIAAFVVFMFGKPGLVVILIAGGVCLLVLVLVST